MTTSGALRRTNVEFQCEVLISLLKFDVVNPFVTKTGDIGSTCSSDSIVELNTNICVRITIYASEIGTTHLFG